MPDFWHYFPLREVNNQKVRRLNVIRRKKEGVYSVMGYIISMMLTGVPPEVCEQTLTQVAGKLKKVLHTQD